MTNEQIQQLLKSAGRYSGSIDGRLGEKSMAGIRATLSGYPDTQSWHIDRRKIAAAQVILNEGGFEAGAVDGYDGHNTQNAFHAWRVQHITRLPFETDRSVSGPIDGAWPLQDRVEDVFGSAGSAACAAGKVVLPIPFTIA